MDDLFELMTTEGEKEGKVRVALGIRVRLADYETLCPITPLCDNLEAFGRASQAIADRLGHLQQEARALFQSPSPTAGLPIGPDTPAHDIWRLLSAVADEAQWVAAFNELNEAQRRAVADHVLTHCNIFSGKAAIFSSRYDSETALM